MKTLNYKTNDTIVFDDHDYLRTIVSGSVDFYIIEKDHNAKKGHRRYVFTLCENCFYPVFETIRESEAYCLIGIAKSKVEINQQKKFDISMCDAAMNTLEKCLPANNHLDPRAQKITVLSTLELDSEEHLLNDSNSGLWIKAVNGEVCINSYEQLSITPETGFLALPPNAFVAAKTYCRLSTCTYEELVSRTEAAETIQNCIQISMDITLDSILKKEALELERIKNKKENNDEELDASLRDLSNLFNETKRSRVMGGDLRAVLLRICRQLGVTLRMPSENSQDIESILETTGLRTRSVILKDDWWNYNCGVLLAWKEEDSVPVALIPSGHGYKMYAPGHSSVRVTAGIASELKSTASAMYVPLPSHSLTVSDILKYILRCIKPYDVMMYLIAGIGVSILALAMPAMTERLFGIIVPRQDTSGLIAVTLFLGATVIASAFLKISQHISHLLFETQSGAPLQAAVWDRLYHLPVNFFKRYGATELLRRASGVESMQKLLTGSCIQGVLGVVELISGFILMMKYNAYLALVLFIVNLVVMLPLIKICFVIGHSEHVIADEEAKSTDVGLQIIQGITKFKTTSTEIKAFSIWEKAFSKVLRLSFKRDNKEAVALSIASIIPSVFLLILYILYMTEIFGTMSMGAFLAFSAAFAEVSQVIVEFCHSALELGEVKACYHHLQPILEECPEGAAAAAGPENLKGNIELKDVTFRYSSDLPTVLRGLSISIPAGSNIAITGKSGCGKSTIVRLLLGFEKPEAGVVSYDGQDISLIDCRQIRKHLGVVLQNEKVYVDDILTNITGKNSSLSVYDAWLAAELAGLDKDINDMSMGMYTTLTENGFTLSGGQRQRLFIARALVNHPKVLIFDEATSALDNKAQAEITARINKLKCTRIIIAHRLSTIQKADKIYYIENGTVAESGTYDELMEKKGLFYQMASQQL